MVQITFKREDKLGSLQRDVGFVSEAMLAFSLNLPWIRFQKYVRSNQFNPTQIRSLTQGFRSDW